MSRDLMRSDEIKAFVRDAYRAVNGSTTRVAERLYSSAELALLPGPYQRQDFPVEVRAPLAGDAFELWDQVAVEQLERQVLR